MKTLHDYVRGYPFVPIICVLDYKNNGTLYQLTKQEIGNKFYFMKGQEVVFAKRYVKDKLEKLMIDHINHKKDLDIINAIHDCQAYKDFVKFIKTETGNTFTI